MLDNFRDWNIMVTSTTQTEIVMQDESKINEVIVYKFNSQKDRDAFELAAQWPEDKEAFKKLITPTNLNELIF
jgi:hypothetical protein